MTLQDNFLPISRTSGEKKRLLSDKWYFMEQDLSSTIREFIHIVYLGQKIG